MTNIDVNDLINQGTKIPGAKFERPGESVAGTIIAAEARQSVKFGTNEPDWWDDAKTQPRMQVVVTLQTDLRDPDQPDDDGQRRLHAKKPGNMLTAIATALNGQRLEVGGRLAIKFIGTTPHEKSGFNPIKNYEAAYQPPAVNAAADLLAGPDGYDESLR